MHQKRILIVGDSHTQALEGALTARGQGDRSKGVALDINWLLSEKNGRIRGVLPLEAAIERISGLDRDDLLVITLLGTAHNIFGLLDHEIPYDFFSKKRGFRGSPDSVEIVPQNALRAMFENTMRNNGRVEKLAQSAPCRVVHLSTPPPKEDNEFIMARAKRYRERPVAEIGIAPALHRLKLWELEMQVLAHICGEFGIDLIAAPAEGVSAEGFLRRDCYANDATHANEAYGELVLRQLERIALQSPLYERAG